MIRTKTERDHGPEWLVRGSKGVVSFFIYDGTPSPIGIHGAEPQHDTQESQECEYLGICYADVTYSYGKKLHDSWLARKSDDVIWRDLERWYRSHLA